MVYYVVQVAKAEPWAQTRVGERIAAFEDKGEANHYMSLARHFGSLRGCELKVHEERWPQLPQKRAAA